MHEKQLTPHLQCGTDPRMIRAYPTMIRPHTRPSRTRRTAQVDHRGSGTNFVWKNIGFRASAINLCSLIVIVWFLKMIVSFWLKKCSIFLLFHFGMVFQHVSFHFLGISFHAKIETWRGGGRSEPKRHAVIPTTSIMITEPNKTHTHSSHA